MKIYWAVILTAATMLSAVGLVSTGAWLISSAALMPPIMVLQVAIVAVRFFGISRGVFRWSERVVSHEVALTGTTKLRVELWNTATRLGPLGVWRFRGSDVLDRLTSDTDTLQDEVTRVRVPMRAAALSAILLSVLQFLFLPLAGIFISLAFLISGFVIPKIISKIEIKIAKEAIHIRNAISSNVYRAINDSEQLRVLDQTTAHLRDLVEADKHRVQVESRASIWAGISGALNGISSATAVFISLIAAVVAFSQAGLNGQLIAVVTLLPWASAEIIGTFSLAATARTRTTMANLRISEFLDKTNEVVNSELIPIINPNELTVEKLKVSWGEEVVIHDLSFKVKRGEIVGLVGPSGSGKSTIANAILRLIPHKGEIALDGTSIHEIAEYEHLVTALLQTTYIFNTTLRENLTLANHENSDAQLIEVLAQVELENWFDELPAGLDTLIGSAERGLSGGEMQRIGIARTLLSGASFVILDEPTEHLDSETADKIWKLVESSFSDMGVVVITHDQRITEKLHKLVSLN